VPLIYIMIAAHHHPAALYLKFGDMDGSWLFLAALIAVSWCVVFWIYKKAAKPEVAAY
jgi:hypothetical protein